MAPGAEAGSAVTDLWNYFLAMLYSKAKLTPEGGVRSTSESARIFFLRTSSLLYRAQDAEGSFLFFCSPEIIGALKYSEKRKDTHKYLLLEYSEVTLSTLLKGQGCLSWCWHGEAEEKVRLLESKVPSSVLLLSEETLHSSNLNIKQMADQRSSDDMT